MQTWVMFSNGPAGQQNIHAAEPHYDDSGDYRDLRNYSATNGTKSRGEIYKWGGDAFWIGVAASTATKANNPMMPGLTIDDRTYLHTMPENK